MNAREAKQEACRRAASVIETAMQSGWPAYDAESDERNYGQQDATRVVVAMNELIAELDRRGGMAPVATGSSASGGTQ